MGKPRGRPETRKNWGNLGETLWLLNVFVPNVRGSGQNFPTNSEISGMTTPPRSNLRLYLQPGRGFLGRGQMMDPRSSLRSEEGFFDVVFFK